MSLTRDSHRESLLAYADAFAERMRHYALPGGDGAIFVDLSHHLGSYFHTNTLIGAYLRHFLGARDLIGVVKQWPQVLEPQRFEDVEAIAQRFGYRAVIALDGELTDPELTALFASFAAGVKSARSPEDAADFVIGFGADQGIGPCIYDTAQRSRFSPQPPEDVEVWLDYGRDCLICLQNARAAMRNSAPVAFVTGHTQYNAYRMPALAALEAKASVFYSHLPRTLHLERYRTVEELICARPGDLEPLFTRWLGEVRPEAPAFKAFADNSRQTILHSRQELHPSFDTPNKEIARTGRPQVAFYVHCLTDATQAWGRYPLRDYRQWLIRSLDVAAANPAIDYIVKPHPYDALYDKSGQIQALRARYEACANIRFTEPGVGDFPPGSIDLAVTVQGSIGYELPQSGLQVLALHGGRYRGLGCAIEPSSEADYFALLSDPLRIAAVSEEQKRRSLLYGFAESMLMRSRSFFLPGLRRDLDPAYWSASHSAWMQHVLEEDPAWGDIGAMIAGGHATLVNRAVAAAVMG